jgi:hypothetical protein
MSLFKQHEMDGLGITNKSWGICGFTSTMYAMYALNPAVRGSVINATRAYKILGEIKTYLKMLEASGWSHLNDIEVYTKSLDWMPGCKWCKDFTIIDYVNRIANCTPEWNDGKLGVETPEQGILADPQFGIGMPPEAVADYVERMWGWRAAVTKGDNGADGIIGVNDPRETGHMYDGLRHYLYRKAGKIYSWGSSYNSVAEAATLGVGPHRQYSVIYVIAVTAPT